MAACVHEDIVQARFYLMVSHTHVRTQCVVNNLLPIIIIISLKIRIHCENCQDM